MKTLSNEELQAVNGAGSITVVYTKGDESLAIKIDF
jgi:bacteriocin-like protein